MYKNLLLLNEKDIFENIYLVVVIMNNCIKKVVNKKFPHVYLLFNEIFWSF